MGKKKQEELSDDDLLGNEVESSGWQDQTPKGEEEVVIAKDDDPQSEVDNEEPIETEIEQAIEKKKRERKDKDEEDEELEAEDRVSAAVGVLDLHAVSRSCSKRSRNSVGISMLCMPSSSTQEVIRCASTHVLSPTLMT